MNVGEIIKKRRESLGLSIAKLAAKADLSPDYIFKIEHQISKNVGIETLEKVAKALGVKMKDLFDTKAA